MPTIKDGVHDHIAVAGVAADLLDTGPVQRLRRISQLGTVGLVYPAANHSRFEHSLGVYHLANEALAHLGVEGLRAERIRAAALLHDVGHGPYSHNLEGLIHRHTGKWHDEVGDLLRGGDIGRILQLHDIDPDRVAALVAGRGKLGQLISGDLDVDRMDYLVRDAHHTGVPYGTIDHGRLVRELRFVGGELVLGEGNVQNAESLLVARALMMPTVYNHHVARIGKAMLRRAVGRAVAGGEVDPATLRRMDDHDLFASLRRSDHPTVRRFTTRLDDRDLYKRAVWAELHDVPTDLLEAGAETLRTHETAIAERAGVESEAVVLDVPAYPELAESSTRVVVNGEVRPLGEQSALVEALRTVGRDQWRLGVYAPPAETDRVGPAAEAVLGLETDALVVEVRKGLHATLDEYQ